MPTTDPAASTATRSRSTRRLRPLQVVNAKPGLHPDGGGLYLRVADSGARKWVLRYTHPVTGKRVDMGLGNAAKDHVSLETARRLATEARDLLAQGVDPIAERERRRSAAEAESNKSPPMTFGVYADQWLKGNVTDSAFRNAKHRAQWRSTLETYAKPIWDKPLAEVTTSDVLECLTPIWSKVPETAKRTQGRIEKVLDAARAAGHRTGENPARWRGHLALLLPKRRKANHHPAMPYRNIPSFIPLLRRRGGVAARALEFLILTAARSGEVRGMTWGELDKDWTTWTVPEDRMKAGRAHRVPLVPQAQDIIREMEALRPVDRSPKDHVFPGGRAGSALSDMTLSAVLKRMREEDASEGGEVRALLTDDRGDDVVVHGFRSTFRDWGEERGRASIRTLEHALAHTIKNAAEAAYARNDAFDERRDHLMPAWAAYLESDDAAHSGKVVSLHT